MFDNLGRALGLLRELRGLSQAALARKTGLGKSQISKYENGKEQPKLESLERLLTALDFQPSALFCLVAFLDRLPEVLDDTPVPPAELTTAFATGRSVPHVDKAFEATMNSLLGLQRSVFELLFLNALRGDRK
jgi:transcriptional regulator with XRE-family HTH domain